MLDDFMVRAALAGVGVALAAAPMGCFVVWRRMAYFGEATAHAAVLGVALALAFSLPILPAVIVAALAMSSAVTALRGRGYAMDTLLGVMAHSALAVGLVAVAMLSNVRLDLMAFLFGDILAVNRMDLATIWLGGLGVAGLILWRWSALILSTLNPDLARASGIDPRREEVWLTLALALMVAVAIKVVGVLLIAAMLVIPAAAARPLVRTPEAMAVTAAIIGALSALGGLYGAYWFDTPAGPSIVCCASLAFAATTVISGLIRR
ncbi:MULTISPECIES: metal ABC transporter permease [Roseobacteraceae]|uniref:High-affinity zinc uptake system membrane protein ZnuB n=1 Tax=Falsiruegeria mediterranea M17 TaxID=1200281 RepID=A0A2R8C7Q0_9RHOB|nr:MULTISPECIES: metal ABC transporter permease [Roseobacteraceae]MBO9449150.1 metal ABC transporter permease [Tropicibacter sp. R16_0]SPJ28445.1 High-affinity zinc uptake system membrane protein ZnuB [Falsiruegeria mediterranea M17]